MDVRYSRLEKCAVERNWSLTTNYVAMQNMDDVAGMRRLLQYIEGNSEDR